MTQTNDLGNWRMRRLMLFRECDELHRIIDHLGQNDDEKAPESTMPMSVLQRIDLHNAVSMLKRQILVFNDGRHSGDRLYRH